MTPRRRRLRWTIAVLLAGAIIGIGLGVVFYHKSRPREYRPDEAEPGITSNLAKKLPAEAPKPLFTEVTREAGLADFRTLPGDRSSQLPEDMGCGIAWGDFDNDGLEDLFLVSGGGPLGVPAEKLSSCELFKNMGDGTFRKVGEFPELRIHGMAAAWADYDEDGFLDLAVTGYNTILLLHNEGGTGKFTISPALQNRPGFWSSAAWGDYDNDRRPDLYICGYVNYTGTEADRAKASAQLGTAVPYTLNPSSFEPIPNLLFHNNGDGTFTEVAEKLQVSNPKGRSLGALWHDFDDDGWLDLYIANDISDNAFYHNQGGTFEDLSYSAWVADYRSAMGLAAGDWSRKGYDDLFISHWVGQQDALYHNVWADLPPTNSSTKPPFGLRFMDVADLRGLGQISLPAIGWGTEFFDFDNDGWLDLVVVNGSTIELDGPVPKKLQPQAPFLFWNQHGEYFHNVAPLSKPLSEKHVGRGLAVADYNHDGSLDLVISHLGEGVQLLRNDLHTGNWLEVQLRSRTSKGAPIGFADGSKAIAHLGNVALRRSITSASYLSQSSRVLHFGLGSASKVERLEVRWHAGPTNFYNDLEANTTWEITERDPTPRRLELKRALTKTSSLPETALPVLKGSYATTARATPTPQSPALDNRAQLVEFWNKERAAMDAMKTELDLPKAIELFRAALELNPQHEDSRYYLGQCLAAQGDFPGALAQLEKLTEMNPQSHRGFQQWGTLRAIYAQSGTDLIQAEESLAKAHALNPEETGALLALGEVSLLRGKFVEAEQRLEAVCRTNPRAVGGLFLRGYLAWRRGDDIAARNLLIDMRNALGKEWRPRHSTSEGDVKRKQFTERTVLSQFWEKWDGKEDPATAYSSISALIQTNQRLSHLQQ